MNHTHVIAFLLGCIAQGLFTIAFCVWDTRRKLRSIRKRFEAENIFDLERERRTKP